MHLAEFKKVLLSECCNCSCNFSNAKSKITKLTFMDKHEEDDSGQEEYKEILNIEALSYIYGISSPTMLSDISKHFQNVEKDFVPMFIDPLELDPINLAFCIQCAKIIEEIYANFEKLYRSSKETSFLAKATEEIRQLLGINELKIDVQDENCDIDDESTDLPLDHLNDSEDFLENNEISSADESSTINNTVTKLVSIDETNENCVMKVEENTNLLEVAADSNNLSQTFSRRRKQMLQTRDEQTFFITCPLCGCKCANSTEFNQHSWDIHKVNVCDANSHQKFEKDQTRTLQDSNKSKESVSKLLSKSKVPDNTILQTPITILQYLNAYEVVPIVSTQTKAISNSFSCQICNTQFPDSIDLQNHCLEVHQPDVKIEQLQSPQLHPVQCLICNSSFRTYEEFKSHQLQDCNENNKKRKLGYEFQNSVSSKRIFSRKRRESAKFKTVKLKIKNIKKPQLQKIKLLKMRCNTNYELLHLKSKRLEGPPFNCPRCKQICEDAITLKTHCRLTHKLIIRNFNFDNGTNEFADLFKCQRCNDSFPDTQSLLIHHKDVHSTQPIRCNKKTIFTGDLKRKTWSQIRYDPEKYLNPPFNCPKCEKVFHELDDLAQHCKFDHTTTFTAKNSRESYLKHKWRRMTKTLEDLGKPPYKCPECEKTFEDLSLLKTHAKSEHTLIIRVAWKDKFQWLFVSPKDFQSPPFNCPKCEKVYEEMSHLKTHCRIVHHYIVCASWKRTGSTNESWKNKIKEAMRKSSQQKKRNTFTLTNCIPPFNCPKCEKVFENVSEIKLHCQSVHNVNVRFKDAMKKSFHQKESKTFILRSYIPPFNCPKCEKVFENVSQMKSHCQSVHNVNVRFNCGLSCDECAKGFKTLEKLKDHCRSSHFDKYCVCDVNSSITLVTQSEVTDKINDEDEVDNAFLCKQCDLSYENFEFLRQHYMDFHSLPISTYEDVTIPFVCLECNKSIETSQGFLIHNTRLHKHDTAYNCKNCPTGEAFSSIEKLTTHMEQAHKIKPMFNRKSKFKNSFDTKKNNVCLKCSKVFNSSQGLDIHTILISSDVEKESVKEMPLNVLQGFCKCKFCSQDFSSVEALNEHTKSKHPAVQSEVDSDYACKVCNKIVQNKKHHLKTVHNRKQCAICNGIYGIAYMPTHMRKKHTGERPFKCNLCEGAFPTLGQLTSHEASHSDVHHFVCASCGVSFKYAGNLHRHEKAQHPSK